MSVVQHDKCPYFTLSVGRVPLPGYYAPMRLPICRCALTETLAARLLAHEQGRRLASLLLGPAPEGQPRPEIGCDLDPVSPVTCTNERKQARCLPGFVETLDNFALDTTAPPEEIV
jgi:hypothetical protein